VTRKGWTGRALALGSFTLGILTEALARVRTPERGAPPRPAAAGPAPPAADPAPAVVAAPPLPLASARARSRRSTRSPAAPARPRRARSRRDSSPPP
jgi:hypothetical protein